MLSIPSSKICTKCGRDLPADRFHKNSRKPDGLACWCKDCKTASAKAVAMRPKVELIEKTCTKCERLLPIEQFHRNKNTADGHVYWCKDCMNAHVDRWYEENREYANRRSQEAYYENRDANLQYRRENYRANKKHYGELGRIWQQQNKDKVSAANQRWRQKYPEKTLIHRHNRIARLHNAEGTYTAEQFQALVEHYGDKCLCCGETKPLTVDHVIALSNGGTNYIGNIQPLCGPCNYSKAAWHNTDYRPDGGEFARKLMED